MRCSGRQDGDLQRDTAGLRRRPSPVPLGVSRGVAAVSVQPNLVREIVVSFAGAAAELHAGHVKSRDEAGAANDEEIAANWLARLDGVDERELRERAAQLVEDYWPAVESVAAQLLQRDNLDYETVSRIVGEQ